MPLQTAEIDHAPTNADKRIAKIELHTAGLMRDIMMAVAEKRRAEKSFIGRLLTSGRRSPEVYYGAEDLPVGHRMAAYLELKSDSPFSRICLKTSLEQQYHDHWEPVAVEDEVRAIADDGRFYYPNAEVLHLESNERMNLARNVAETVALIQKAIEPHYFKIETPVNN